jgi:hypothetical protein
MNARIAKELGDQILDTVTQLAKCSRHAGLFHASEALDDALILVHTGLHADCGGKHHSEIERSRIPVFKVPPP